MPGKRRIARLEAPRDTDSLRKVLRAMCASYGNVARVRIGIVTKHRLRRAVCFVDMKQKVPVPAALRKLGFRPFRSSFYISFYLPADFARGITAPLLLIQQLMDWLSVPVLLGC